MAFSYNMQVISGDDEDFQVTWAPSGVLADLTGYSIQWVITFSDRVLDYNSDDNPDVVAINGDPTTGIFDLIMSNALTSTLLIESGRYYVRVTSSGGKQSTLMIGDIRVSYNK